DDLSIARDELTGLDQDEVVLAQLGAAHRRAAGAGRVEATVRRHGGETPRRDVAPLPAQLVGLGGATALRHRLGEVREQDREPQPEADGEDEARRRLSVAAERLQEQARGEHAADLDHEHDRVLHLVARVELPERADDRTADDGRIEERTRLASTGGRHHAPPPYSDRCSTTGPRASAGRNVRAPTMITTPINMTTKSGVCVGRVPGPTGTIFFLASEPAMASVGIASQ